MFYYKSVQDENAKRDCIGELRMPQLAFNFPPAPNRAVPATLCLSVWKVVRDIELFLFQFQSRVETRRGVKEEKGKEKWTASLLRDIRLSHSLPPSPRPQNWRKKVLRCKAKCPEFEVKTYFESNFEQKNNCKGAT